MTWNYGPAPLGKRVLVSCVRGLQDDPGVEIGVLDERGWTMDGFTVIRGVTAWMPLPEPAERSGR